MDRSLPARGAPRWVPLSYLTLAHLGLASACAVILWDPALVAGFFYHPKMIAVVHTLTLGWISSSLIGILYLAAARTGFVASRFDAWLFAAWAVGASGLASHFWIEEFSGMAWSAGLLVIAIGVTAGRFGMAFAVVDIPAAVTFPLNLAWLNLLATAFVGLLIGINKTDTILPGYSLHNVFAHAHLAALGWAFVSVTALAHVSLDAPPRRSLRALRWSLYGSAVVQIGAAGVFVSLLLDEPYAAAFGGASLIGISLCGAGVAAHARAAHPRPGGPVSAAWTLGFAGIVVAAAVAAALLSDTLGSAEPEGIMGYGVTGLLAGLGSLVLGLALLWLRRLSGGAARTWPAVVCWAIAAPLLAAGLTANRHTVISAGATFLLAAGAWTARSWYVFVAKAR